MHVFAGVKRLMHHFRRFRANSDEIKSQPVARAIEHLKALHQYPVGAVWFTINPRKSMVNAPCEL